MNLTVIYKANQIGEKLLHVLQLTYEDIEHRHISINSEDYWQIDINNQGSEVRRIVNTPRAVRNSFDPQQASGILRPNNIYFGLSEDEMINRTYEVMICDLEILSIKAASSAKGKQQAKYIRERDNQKVADLARRTAYLLGLDIAMVTIVLTGKRRYRVVGIDPSPPMRDKDFHRVGEHLKRMTERDGRLKEIEVKLGADPEFMLVNSKTGKMISASQFFPREGVVGCDNIRVPNRQQRPVAEVRPRPEMSPLELAANIKQALNSATRLAPYRNVRWVAGSQPVGGYSIGGHIHFSKVQLDGGFLRALDNYLGIPVFLLENPVTAAKRRRKYGYVGDYRLKEHGGFEYRTPGSWLVSQKIATAVLCLAKVIANRYAELPQNYLNTPEAQYAFYEGNQEFFRSLFFSLWSNLERLDLYRQYEDELKIIPDMVIHGTHWDEKADLRRGWKISTPQKNYYSPSAKAGGRPAQVSSTSTITSTARGSRSGSIRSANSVVPGNQMGFSTSTDRRSVSSHTARRVTSGQVRRTNISR